MQVDLVTHGVRHSLPRRVLVGVARVAMGATRCSTRAELEVALVGDATIARLNQRFMGHRGPTDVLTFPGGDGPLLGEIVISVDRARAQARRLGHSLGREVALLIVHGVLHLRGYDDRTPQDAARMQTRAEAILAAAFDGRRPRRARGRGAGR
ncbi:MAG: rRNA maturation RNase YbeY [Armatimonadetes bacterium]|nr:rRNA maturation RNase YbeY [Armatimonadota bacterium]